MYIDVIEDFDAFTRLKENWDAVYERDPDSHFFISSEWLADWLVDDKAGWFILAAKRDEKDADYVAFFPLRLRSKVRKNQSFYNEIGMAGRGLSDYTGLVTLPEIEDEAVVAFANYLKRRNWTYINLEYMRASEHRKSLFLDQFASRRFDQRHIPSVNRRDNIDNDICPYIALPETFDDYLATVSTNTRQKIRRFLRMVENSDEYRITLANADTIAEDAKNMLEFWRMKWGARKGDRLRSILRTNFVMLKRAFASDCLFMPTLWQGDRPLGSLGIFVDHHKKAMLFFIAGRDETFNGPPAPGLVLHGWSIRYAIENGFKTYDFLRGNEPYKYSFAQKEGVVKKIVIGTRNRKNLGNRLDPASINYFLRRTTKLHEAGKLEAAEHGYRQILQSNPELPGALYGFGQLMAAKGNHAAAAKAFKTLVTVRPNAAKAWLRLARSLEARERFADAAEAYRQITIKQPNSRSAYNKLGETLLKLGRFDEASAAFNVALGKKSANLPNLQRP